jgi:hypothetical protein
MIACLSICPSIYLLPHQPVEELTFLSIQPFVCISFHGPVYRCPEYPLYHFSIFDFFACTIVCFSVVPHVCMLVSLSVCMLVFLCISISLFVSVSLHLCVFVCTYCCLSVPLSFISPSRFLSLSLSIDMSPLFPCTPFPSFSSSDDQLRQRQGTTAVRALQRHLDGSDGRALRGKGPCEASKDLVKP